MSGVDAFYTHFLFVFDISDGHPKQRQVLTVANSFNGIVWNPSGQEFYVSGGSDDSVHIFTRRNGLFAEFTELKLGHSAGMGLVVKPAAAGLAVSPSGTRLLVANYENDSVSLIDLARYAVIAELDLRPGRIDPARAGIAGGEYPLAVAWSSDDHAFVTSQRDREVVLLAVGGGTLSVAKRIKTAGQPNEMIIDRARTRLYVACDNSDSVLVLDAATGDKRAEITTRAPQSLLSAVKDWKGANPNNLALSLDGRRLFVTNGGMNALASFSSRRTPLRGVGTNARRRVRSARSRRAVSSASFPLAGIPMPSP